MAKRKKNFTSSLGSSMRSLILYNEVQEVTNKYKEDAKDDANKLDQTEPAATITTFKINDDNLPAIKALAWWKRKRIQEVFKDALSTYNISTLWIKTYSQKPKIIMKRSDEHSSTTRLGIGQIFIFLFYSALLINYSLIKSKMRFALGCSTLVGFAGENKDYKKVSQL